MLVISGSPASGQELQNASDTNEEATMPVRSPGVLLFGLAVMLWTLTGCSEEPRAEPPLGQVERTETITAADLVLVTNGRGVARMVGTLVNDAEEEDRLVGQDIGLS